MQTGQLVDQEDTGQTGQFTLPQSAPRSGRVRDHEAARAWESRCSPSTLGPLQLSSFFIWQARDEVCWTFDPRAVWTNGFWLRPKPKIPAKKPVHTTGFQVSHLPTLDLVEFRCTSKTETHCDRCGPPSWKSSGTAAELRDRVPSIPAKWRYSLCNKLSILLQVPRSKNLWSHLAMWCLSEVFYFYSRSLENSRNH